MGDEVIVVNEEGEDINLPLDSIILRQYTGLHDMTGKEIYDGDIVKTPKNIPNMMRNQSGYIMALAEVVLEVGAFRFKFGDEMPLAHSGCEVIGNIYEHSHLLKEKE
jgi:uncharacterized phage protein (TIGR01671 family)